MERTILASFIILCLLSATSALIIKHANSSEMIYIDQTYGGTSNDAGYWFVQTLDGGFAIAGFTASFGAEGGDFWLIKTDEAGNHQWNQTYGGTNSYDIGWSVVQTLDGGFAIAGYTRSFGSIYDDVWLVKTDAEGNYQWNQTYGGTDFDLGRSVVQTVDGGFAIAGYTYSFGAGNSDVWLVKTDESGVIPEFPAWTLFLAVIIFTVSIIIYRRKLVKTTNH